MLAGRGEPSESMLARMTEWRSASITWAGMVALAVLLAVGATWPAVLYLDTHLIEPITSIDVQCGMWWPWAFAQALVHGQPIFYRTDLVWPDGQDIRLNAWNFLAPLVFLPVTLLASPVAAMNLRALGSMVLDGLACGWAAWKVTGRRAGAAAALVIGSTCAYTWIEGDSGRLEQALWAPIALYLGGLVLLRREPGRWHHRLFCGVWLAIAGGVYWFYGYFLVVLTLLFGAWWAAMGNLDRRGFIDLFWVGALALLFVVPFLVPTGSALLFDGSVYRAMRDSVAHPLLWQSRAALEVPAGFIGPFGGPLMVRSWRLSVLVLPLSFWVALGARGPARLLGASGLLGAVFAAGAVLVGFHHRLVVLAGRAVPLPMALLDLLPGWHRFWWPYRWVAVATAGAALCAGWVVARLRRATLALVLLGAFCMGESALLLRNGIRLATPAEYRAVVPEGLRAIAALEGTHPILELPLGQGIRLAWQIWHHQPIDGGMAWVVPAGRSEAWKRRARELPLWRAATSALAGEVVEHPAPWTTEETGGFEYVLLSHGGPGSREFGGAGKLDELLGPPFYCDGAVAVWAVPGVSAVPPGLTAESTPCWLGPDRGAARETGPASGQ